MEIQAYLDRIGFNGVPHNNLETFSRLHQCHVQSVPFENLDIRFNRRLTLDINPLFNKVVLRRRGGFCYELNYLFSQLLGELGFSTKLLSGRVYKDGIVAGPEFDHLLLLVSLDEDWIADVGYGDLFIQPLELKPGRQRERVNSFELNINPDGDYDLLMQEGNSLPQKRYAFSLSPHSIESFIPSCEEKQVSPESFFVKNTIVTLPTSQGRRTIFNSRYTETIGGNKVEIDIQDDATLKSLVKSEFGMDLN